MGAFVQHEFERGFVLDEERVRKLASIVVQRLDPTVSGSMVEYVVYRGDAFWYVTTDLSEVVAEDNLSWKQITRLDIRSTDAAAVKLKLSFSQSDGAAISIEGEDRDAVFVLYSDLRNYIDESVTTAIHVDPATVRVGSLLFFMGVALWVLWTATVTDAQRLPSQDQVEAALRATDISVKLNFVIARYARTPRFTMFWPMVAMFTVMSLAMMDVPQKIIRYVSPSNVFLFGAQRVRFDQRRRLLANVWWVVVIGGAVSALTGVLVWWLTLNK